MPNICDLGSDGSDVCWDCGRRINFVCHHCLTGGEKTTTYEEACYIEQQNMDRRFPVQTPCKWVELPCQIISENPLTINLKGTLVRFKEYIPWKKTTKGIVLLKEKLGGTLKDKCEIMEV